MIEALYPVVAGPVVAALVEVCKRVPVIPVNSESRAAIVAALVVVSLLVRLALAYFTGTLETFDWRGLLDAIASALAAAGAYSLAKQKGAG